MTIEDFLDDMAKYQSRLQVYQKTRSQFADDCVSEIFACLREHYAYTKDFDTKTLNSLVCEFKQSSTELFSALDKFMEHYEKTEEFSFQIIPEESWSKEIEAEGVAGDFKQFCNSNSSHSISFEDDVAKFKELRKRSKEVFLQCHKMLKKKTFEYFPSIVDLPSLGLRELDFLLFQQTKQLMHTFSIALG